MNLKQLQNNWESFGNEDPYWAILTDPTAKHNAWNIDEFFKTGEVSIQHLLNKLERLNIPWTSHKALDFGCGVGRLSLALAHHFDQVIGVDIASSMIQLANKHNSQKKKLRYVQIDNPALDEIGEERFDFIHTVLTLQHIEPKYAKQYVKQFIHLLKPDGLLYFQIPTKPPKGIVGWLLKMLPTAWLNVYRKWKNNHAPIMEMHWISKETIERLIQLNDAKIIHSYSEHKTGGFENTWYFIKKR